MSAGLLAAALSYALWGLFPLYFHQVAQVPALEIVVHRSVWSMVFVLGLLTVLRRWAWVAEVVKRPRTLAVFGASALLLSTNWLIYVWAVNNARVMEASLGYFINPLVNVALGMLFLHEKLRPAQRWALAVAGAGVAWLTWSAGVPPWIALALAFSFGVYGLLRKTAPLGALEGLALETALLAPLALPALIWLSAHGGALVGASPSTWAWLLFAGPLTAVPLLLFAHGARRVTMATLGLLQYLAPTIQFALAVWVFHEPLRPERLVGFVLIWIALALYSAESLWRMRQQASSGAAAG
ncbi:EamA family transporter RarD [Ideonella sp. DXS29W]|uniref:EamA family transporter RarD n=1 Tax=Ideonella lacteola TaxID=2984193 RepID=A0ABU9BI94_9BURK